MVALMASWSLGVRPTRSSWWSCATSAFPSALSLAAPRNCGARVHSEPGSPATPVAQPPAATRTASSNHERTVLLVAPEGQTGNVARPRGVLTREFQRGALDDHSDSPTAVATTTAATAAPHRRRGG